MFQVLILICSVGLAPGDCQVETALDVVRGPVAPNALLCGLHGQAYIAPTALAPRGPGEYVKIKCLRQQPARQALKRREHMEPPDRRLRAHIAADD
jgi:hypothetical protein